MKELRRKQGMTAERLAQEMKELGVPFDKTVIANLETGRRRFVTVQEFLALAYVLSVAPVHLLVPPDAAQDDPYRVLPGDDPFGVAFVRAWIRGFLRIGSVDPRLYFLEAPDREWTIQGGGTNAGVAAVLPDEWERPRGKGGDDGERQ